MYRPGSLAAAGQSVERFPRWVDELGRGFSEDYFVYTLPSLPLPNSAISLAPLASVTLRLQISDEHLFEWVAMAGSVWNGATGAQLSNPNILVQITDQASQRQMFSNPLPWTTFIGTGQHPFILPVSKRFCARNMFTVTLTNFDSVATYSNIHLSFIGRQILLRNDHLGGTARNINRFREWQAIDPVTGETRTLSEDVFCYVTRLDVLSVIIPTFVKVFMTPDADFEWIETTGCANNQAGNTPLTFLDWIAQISFTDGAQQRDLQNFVAAGNASSGITSGATVGTGTFPFILPIPRLFLAKSSCDITFESSDLGIATQNVYVCQWGRKIFEATNAP